MDESIDIDALFFAMLYYHIKMLIQRSGGTGPMKLRQPVTAGSSKSNDRTIPGYRVATPAAQAGR